MAPALAEGNDLLDDSLPVRPVDKHHSDDDADYHAGRSDRKAKGRAVVPSCGKKALRHSADGAVAALEADLYEIAEERRDVAQACEDEAREAKAHDVLAPRHDLPEDELRERKRHDALQVREARSEEERREDDVYEKARHLAHRVGDFRVDFVAESRYDSKSDRPPDDGAWEIQPLQERDPEPDELAGDEKPAEGDEHYDGQRHRAPFMRDARASRRALCTSRALA